MDARDLRPPSPLLGSGTHVRPRPASPDPRRRSPRSTPRVQGFTWRAGSRRARRGRSAHRGGRDLRAARAQRRRQDHPDQDSQYAAVPDLGRGTGRRIRRGARRAGGAPPHRAGLGRRELGLWRAHRSRVPLDVLAVLWRAGPDRPAAHRGTDRRRGPRAAGGHAHQPAVHGGAPADELRARLRLRSGDPVPRRADAGHGRERGPRAARVRRCAGCASEPVAPCC